VEPFLIFFGFCLGGPEAEVVGGGRDAGDSVVFVEADSEDFLRISRSESRAVGLSSAVQVDRKVGKRIMAEFIAAAAGINRLIV